jgi:hypothetical protein
MAPFIALGMGAALSGCAYMNDYGEVGGEPFAEFDPGDSAPTAIELAVPDRVVIVDGDGFDIALEGDREAGEALRFSRDGDTLTIARDSSIFDGSGRATVRLTMPSPRIFELAGSGTIDADSLAPSGDIEIAGSGRVTVDRIVADTLDVEIAGSGKVAGAGSAQRLTIEIAGSGDVDFTALTADDANIEIAGSGDVRLSSDGKVHAEIAGSGDVVVSGSADCSLESAGSGTLRCDNTRTAMGGAGK